MATQNGAVGATSIPQTTVYPYVRATLLQNGNPVGMLLLTGPVSYATPALSPQQRDAMKCLLCARLSQIAADRGFTLIDGIFQIEREPRTCSNNHATRSLIGDFTSGKLLKERKLALDRKDQCAVTAIEKKIVKAKIHIDGCIHCQWVMQQQKIKLVQFGSDASDVLEQVLKSSIPAWDRTRSRLANSLPNVGRQIQAGQGIFHSRTA